MAFSCTRYPSWWIASRPHQQTEPLATALKGRPASAIAPLTVAPDLWRITQAHLSPRHSDRLPSTR
jgi:hypothetical protein